MRYLIFVTFLIGCSETDIHSGSSGEQVYSGFDESTEFESETEQAHSATDTLVPVDMDTDIDTIIGADTSDPTDTSAESETSTETSTETDTLNDRLVVVDGLTGGSPQQQCYYDLNLEIGCCPFLAGDGVVRCLPYDYAEGALFVAYEDQMCNEILASYPRPDEGFFEVEIPIDNAPDFIISPRQSDDAGIVYDVFVVGSQIVEGMLYVKIGNDQCVADKIAESSATRYYYFRFGGQVDPSYFAEI